MRLARVALIWSALATGIVVPIIAAATSPLLAWRDPVYIAAGFAGIVALGPSARSAPADERMPAGTVGASRTAHSSLDGNPARRGGSYSRWGSLVHQSAGRDRRSPLRIADAVLCLGRDRHVGHLRHSTISRIPPPVASATALVAHRSYGPRSGHSCGECGPCHTHRGDDGDDVESSAVRTGPCGDRQSHR